MKTMRHPIVLTDHVFCLKGQENAEINVSLKEAIQEIY